jgi:serine/threonine-protein kinase OSR1/STK39
MQQRIGRGAFSSVHKAHCITTGTDVAIKIMDLEGINSSIEDVMQEVFTMRLSSHPNVLACYCSFVDGDKLWLVTQLMDKGSCLRVMHLAKSHGMGDGESAYRNSPQVDCVLITQHMYTGMDEAWVAYIIGQTLHGLKYLHDHGQIHRDIKAGNILVDTAGNVR